MQKKITRIDVLIFNYKLQTPLLGFHLILIHDAGGNVGEKRKFVIRGDSGDSRFDPSIVLRFCGHMSYCHMSYVSYVLCFIEA